MKGEAAGLVTDMNKKMRTALEAAFSAPPPRQKRAFLKKYRRRELGRLELLLIQARYIHPLIWGISALLFGAILWNLSEYDQSTIQTVCALTPFLALLAVTENGKSRRYQMEELELSCRISLQRTALARMTVLGSFHFILLAALAPALSVCGALGLARAGMYLLAPYLLTASLGLELTRRIRGSEGTLACGAAAALVSVLGITAQNLRPESGQTSNLLWWGTACAVGFLALAAELAVEIKKAAALQWN